MDYHDKGLCVIPGHPTEKTPAVKWQRYQSKRPSESSIRNWFKRDYRVGLLMGEVSGNLGCRDFDDKSAFDEWLKASPLANELPVSKSRRGGQVWFRTAPGYVTELRAKNRRFGNGALPVDFEGHHLGELRVDVGCFCLVAPSPHPEGNYQWLRPLPSDIKDLPEIDPVAAGLYPQNSSATLHRHADATRATGFSGGNWFCEDSLLLLLRKTCVDVGRLHCAVDRCLPSGVGHRHRQIFDLARELKSFPPLATMSASELSPIFDLFYERALPVMSAVAKPMPYEEAYGRFSDALEKVKFPKDCEPIQDAWRAAMEGDDPECASRCRSAQARWLVKLCAELQRRAGKGNFYLCNRTAGRLLGVSHSQANFVLKALKEMGIIRLAKEHDFGKHEASEWRYLGDFPELGDAWEPAT
jgi:hypothetical protein